MKTIYISSVIPQITELLSKKLPETIIKEISVKGNFSNEANSNKYDKETLHLQDAEIILGDGHFIMQIYDRLPNTKWIQCTWAGVEDIVKRVQEQGIKPKFPITRMASPVFSQLMGEYVVGSILNYERGWMEAHQYQLKKIWAKEGKIIHHRSLCELTVGVLGVGKIGSKVISSLKNFNCTVLAFGRRLMPPENLLVDQYFSSLQLALLLEKCDYVVNVLPSTPTTRGLLGQEMLSVAKKKPVLINVGRGDVMTEHDVINALDKAWISGAILDTFEQEPLPPSSPLWLHPKVVITPHVAAVSRPKDIVECFCSNFVNYLKGQPLQNIVDWDEGY